MKALPKKRTELTDKQRIAIPLLVSGMQQAKVAKRVGITRWQFSRWHAMPVFAAALHAARSEAHTDASTQLRALLKKATDVLGEALDSKNARIRLRAAALILRATVPTSAALDVRVQRIDDDVSDDERRHIARLALEAAREGSSDDRH